MNAPARTFEAKPAVRESVPLLVGLMGASGSGKTYSALRLASGIQKVSGGDVFFVDTEARRALHYADTFKFKHIEFNAPFGSLDYLAAIEHCVKLGAKVIVIDSMTHEHTGPGGYLLTQEAEVDRMAGNDYAKRDRVKMAGWIKPAGLRQRMITGILQLNANFIFCFRAKEKTKPKTGGGIQELGFMPIAGEELLFEMTVNCLLMPKSNGVPNWRSDQVGERMMMKLPKQFEAIFAAERALDETIGSDLAAWAKGSPPPHRTTEAVTAAPSSLSPEGGAAEEDDSERIARLDSVLAEAATRGLDSLKTAWGRISAEDRPILKVALDKRHKPTAVKVDEDEAAAS